MYGVCTFRVHADKLVKEIDNHHESERAGDGGGSWERSAVCGKVWENYSQRSGVRVGVGSIELIATWYSF